MTPLRVAARPAVDADLDDLNSLVAAASTLVRPARGGFQHLDVDGEGWSISARYADADAIVLVGMLDEVAVGYVVLSARRAAATIEAMYVDPEAREVGLGEALLDSAIAWSQGRGCSTLDAVALPGDRHTKNFFETFGMVARAITVSRAL